MSAASAPSGAPGDQIPVRILIVTVVRLYREGLASVLANRGGIEIVGTAAPSDELLAQLAELRPHVVLADSAVVRTEILREVAALDAGPRVVAFAVAEDDEREVLACAEAGVAGFVARDAPLEELMTAIQTAVQGGIRCSPRVAGLIIRRVADVAASHPTADAIHALTRREGEIVRLIDTGLSNKEIGVRLGIETATVKNHVHNLLEKLRVRRRAEAAALIRRHGRLPGARAQI